MSTLIQDLNDTAEKLLTVGNEFERMCKANGIVPIDECSKCGRPVADHPSDTPMSCPFEPGDPGDVESFEAERDDLELPDDEPEADDDHSLRE